MLNRRILRIKAFKVLYSYAENRTMTLNEALSALDISCEATRDLYLLMLSIAGPLTAEAARRAEAASRKFNPTEEELHPNLKFVRNGLAPLLAALAFGDGQVEIVVPLGGLDIEKIGTLSGTDRLRIDVFRVSLLGAGPLIIFTVHDCVLKFDLFTNVGK